MGKTYKTVEEYVIGETGKDMTGMSKQETQNAESAFAGYKQKNNLQNIYDSAVANMDKNLQTDQRTAYFNNEKLMKYLPNNLKVQGLQGNVGAMNQAYIDANNSYQTNLNALTQNYNQTKTNMLNDYNTNVLKIDESVRQEQNQNNKYWQDVQNALEAEKRANTREDKLIADERAREDKLIADENTREDSANLLNYASQLIGDFASTLTPDENGKYSAEDIQKIKSFVEENNLYEGLSDNDKNMLDMAIAGFIQMDYTEQFEYDTNKQSTSAKDKAVNQYGVSNDAEQINSANANVYSFGKHNGTGKGTEQDSYVNDILSLADSGQIPNGKVIDFNYGAGKSSNYIFIDGYWFKTDKKADYNNKNYSVLQKFSATGKPNHRQR